MKLSAVYALPRKGIPYLNEMLGSILGLVSAHHFSIGPATNYIGLEVAGLAVAAKLVLSTCLGQLEAIQDS